MNLDFFSFPIKNSSFAIYFRKSSEIFKVFLRKEDLEFFCQKTLFIMIYSKSFRMDTFKSIAVFKDNLNRTNYIKFPKINSMNLSDYSCDFHQLNGKLKKQTFSLSILT